MDDVESLQACVNGLIDLLALSAVWTDDQPGQLASTLLDALVRLQRLDFACFEAARSDWRRPDRHCPLGFERRSGLPYPGAGTCPRRRARWRDVSTKADPKSDGRG